MIFTIFLVTNLIYECISKKYVLLPYDSDLCQNNSQGIHKFYDFTVNQQINLNTDINVTDVVTIMQLSSLSRFQLDTENYKYYLCRILVKPMGRSLENHDVKGFYSFWNVRIKIDRIRTVPNCNDYIFLQFRHKDNIVSTLEAHSDNMRNISSKDALPITVASPQRKLYITYFSPGEHSRCGYTINVTSFIYFKGDFSAKYQENMCRRHDGFWCVNTTACIFRDMKCDGYDSCFDGGSDEKECFTPDSNFTVVTVRPKLSSGFIDYLPWLAVGILPLILLLALICICSQHRSEVYFDDEEDNLDVDKSHDGDEVWSSVDGLEKTNGDIVGVVEEVDEDGEGGGEWMAIDRDGGDEGGGGLVNDDGAISLVALTHHRQDTTKADIAVSRTMQSINRDYEDIDQPGELPTMNSILGLTHCGDLGEQRQNLMTMSQTTDDDYEDHLEDVGSLLRKVDKSRIPEEVRLTGSRPSATVADQGGQGSPAVTTVPVAGDSAVDYRSDYILV